MGGERRAVLALERFINTLHCAPRTVSPGGSRPCSRRCARSPGSGPGWHERDHAGHDRQRGPASRSAARRSSSASRRQLFNRLSARLHLLQQAHERRDHQPAGRAVDRLLRQPVREPRAGGQPRHRAAGDAAGDHATNFSWEIIGNLATEQRRDQGSRRHRASVVERRAVQRRRLSDRRHLLASASCRPIAIQRPAWRPTSCATAAQARRRWPAPRAVRVHRHADADVTGSVGNTFYVRQRLRLYGAARLQARQPACATQNEELRCTGAVGAPLCRANYYPLSIDPVYLAETTSATAVGTRHHRSVLSRTRPSRSCAKCRPRTRCRSSCSAASTHGVDHARRPRAPHVDEVPRASIPR